MHLKLQDKMSSLKIFGIFFIITIPLHAEFYGFLKASAIHSDHPLNSFNYVNMTAPTSSANRSLYSGESGDRSGFQVAQSRIGGKFNVNEYVKALREIDFIDV